VFKLFGVFLLVVAAYILYDVATIYFGFENDLWRSLYMELNGDEFYLKLGFGIVCLVLGLYPFSKKRTS
jgi:hypothetical protein